MLKSLFEVMTKYEAVAVWLEGIALVLILLLDFSEYVRQGSDRKQQHTEMLEQLKIMKQQANATIDAVVAAQQQRLEEQHRELLRAISILDDIRYQSTYWREISDNSWGAVNEASSIMPPDSDVVLIQAARHSNDMRNEVRETFRMLSNADAQIVHFYSVDRASYRQEQLMKNANLNLKNAESKLTHIIGVFEQMESESKLSSQPSA